jgi:hypothetical protein
MTWHRVTPFPPDRPNPVPELLGAIPGIGARMVILGYPEPPNLALGTPPWEGVPGSV